MARYCTSCGAPVEEGVRFCTVCGAPVADTPAPATSPAPKRMSGAMIAATSAAAVAAIALICGTVFVLNPFGAEKAESASEVKSAGSTEIVANKGEASSSKKAEEKSVDGSSSASESSSDSFSTSTSAGQQSISTDSSVSSSTAQAQPQQQAQSQQSAGTYILSDSAARVYSVGELSGLTSWQLMMARNEIYARHGRGFNDAEIRSYFQGQPWYHQRYTAEEFDASHTGELSSVEQQNIANILSVENSR